jgi:Tol biopolymer transport system component/serine/threonine protein kinase
MGAVYRAFDINLGVSVAVKENLFTTQEYARQFRREATILASLRHPNLPRVTDHFVIEGEGQYLVMDFIKGEDLRQRLEREGPHGEEVVLPWFLEIADALAYLHSRTPSILHRDIKPGNIKITPEGRALLVDFGLAKVVEEGGETTTGARAMTPGFSPPEQYGSGRTDVRTDIYSLAATLYTALTATIPEDSLERALRRASLTSIRQRNSSVSYALARTVEQGLALEPDQRYQTVNEFADALAMASTSGRLKVGRDLSYLQQTVVRGRRTQIPSPSTLVLEEPKVRRRWPMVALLVTAVLVIGAGAIYAVIPRIGSSLAAMLPRYLEVSAGPPTSTGPESGTSTAVDPINTETQSAIGIPTETRAAVEATLPGTGELTPTPPGGGVGLIAFASDRSGVPQVTLMNIDGTSLRDLTQLPDGACQPNWSPDGTRVVFTSPCRTSRNQYAGSSVWVINADGSELRPLATAPGGSFDPAWSPDGDLIAYTSLQDGWPQIYVMNSNGGEKVNLSGNTAHERNPSWSPSGTQLIFSSTRSGVSEIWVMTADGSDSQRFSRSAGRDDNKPSWSPDGELVIFDQEIGGLPRLVATQFIEGGAPEVRICAEGPLSVQPMAEPHFSPDGRWVIFETWPTGVDHNIGLMTVSCTNYVELTDHEALDFDAAWSP